MSQLQNRLFPLILDILSRKPLLSETQANLLKDVNQKLTSESVKVNNLKKEFDTTVNLGKGLGILSVQNEEVRMPFLLKGAKTIGWTRPPVESPDRAAPSRSKTEPPETPEQVHEKPDSAFTVRNVKSKTRSKIEAVTTRNRGRRSRGHIFRKMKRAARNKKTR